MKIAYIAKDELGLAGKTISFTQGETKTISVFLFNPDGSPFTYSGTVTELALKIFSSINAASISKKLSLSTVTLINSAGAFVSTLTGFQFSLNSADTTSMAVNNSGLPMVANVTDSDGNILEIDFIALFNVTGPVVTT